MPRAFCAPGKQGQTGFLLSVYKVGFRSRLCPLAIGTRFSTSRRGEIAVTSCPGLARNQAQGMISHKGRQDLLAAGARREAGALSGLGWPGREDRREARGPPTCSRQSFAPGAGGRGQHFPSGAGGPSGLPWPSGQSQPALRPGPPLVARPAASCSARPANCVSGGRVSGCAGTWA